MTREWAPGDVALIAHYDPPMVAVVRKRREAGGALEFAYVDGGFDMVGDAEIRDSARPLVVIDAADREQVERLRDLVDVAHAAHGTFYNPSKVDRGNAMQAALREFANPPPPRIEEPGTWGVVEASCPHSDKRHQWIRHPDGNWWPAFDYSTVPERTPLPDDWSDLIDPELVRDGVA